MLLDSPAIPQGFWEVARQQYSPLRAAIAGASRIPAALLRALLIDPEPQVRQAAMLNPRAVRELGEWLLERDDPSVFLVLVLDHETPVNILHLFANLSDNTLHLNIARHPNADASILERMLVSESLIVRQEASIHVHAPSDFVDLLRQAGAGPTLEGDGLPQATMERSDLARLVAAGGWAGQLTARFAGVESQWLERCAVDRRDDLRAAAAQNPELMRDALHRLALDPSPAVREAVAMNRACSPDALVALLCDEHVEVRQAARLHPSLPPWAPALLARGGSAPDLDDYVGGAPVETRSDLERLLGLGPYGRYIVARNRGVDPEWIGGLASDDVTLVRSGVARNPSSSPSIMSRLSRDESWEVRAACAENQNVSAEMLDMIASDEDPLVRMRVAVTSAVPTPEWLVVRLAADPDRAVRVMLARRARRRNGFSPSLRHVVERLAADGDRFVRIELACGMIPEDILAILSDDQNVAVRAALARNARAPASLLSQLARDPDPWVRAGAASNSSLPDVEIEPLLRDDETVVRAGLAANSKVGPVLLEAWLLDGSLEVRAGLARNPMIPGAVLTRWAQDERAELREAVASNIGAPRGVLEALALDPAAGVRFVARSNPQLWPAKAT